jgi:hypothetical protein
LEVPSGNLRGFGQALLSQAGFVPKAHHILTEFLFIAAARGLSQCHN